MSNPSASPTHQAVDTRSARGEKTSVSVLLYSDNITVRDSVRASVGRRPARDVEVESWHECATAPAVIEAVEAGGLDILILDGEAAKVGGMGLCRSLKSEIYRCPPVLILTGRPQDGWLATWSLADAVVPHPIDAVALADTVATLARTGQSATVQPESLSDAGRPGPDAD